MANYEERIQDTYTGEIAIIKSNDWYIFNQKKENKLASWEKRGHRLHKQQTKEEGLEEANRLTNEALENIKNMKNILKYTLGIDDKINWESLKDYKKFKQFKFDLQPPDLNSYLLQAPRWSIFEYIFKSITIKRKAILEEKRKEHELAMERFNKNKERKIAEYELEKKQFEKLQEKHNKEVEDLKSRFEKNEPEAIEEYLDLVFSKSKYPDFITLSYDLLFDESRKTIIVNVELPDPDSLPKEVDYKYIASRDEFTTKVLKKKEFSELYEEVISQIAIRTVHEIFESVYTNSIDFVVLNGYVNSIDKKTGNDTIACIVSIQAEREYFNSLNLTKISAKECIKGLKGLIASEFINLAPVKPILNLNREDRRIIESEAVIDDIDSNNNLASMDWQKFETLVRDIFAKEFAGEGVDVKVTQASRDAGVDAIIFDPDPIKGGKFVIQAKRYNNIVGVSAVRDLFGTVMNEGAVKGILVTTSNFGKDSIEFAKDKPLTLISGAHLVHLFNKHGYNVNIKIKQK
ncbi:MULTISPECIES: restriction endonuclease [Leptospira]|uniref:Restriction endonuclease n=1 Tax=Leptospira limi TaxID=2950023 RepID=A0ABT3M1Z6_9LEPT|nr:MULTISPECIES: restriction endonuclease [Leptospira]MCW7463999.1 restriction endonuclease [Leptospira limi]TGK92561.1 restriction endonuclease [Leptospira levettii]